MTLDKSPRVEVQLTKSAEESARTLTVLVTVANEKTGESECLLTFF